MARPSFMQWAKSAGGLYLHDKKKPTLARWEQYTADILDHVFPAGNDDGILPYSRILWSEPKKSGKTELAAGVHLYYALYVDVPGEQYVLANDLLGAKSRAFQSITGSLEKNPKVRAGDWNVVGTQINLSNGSTIRAIPSDYKGEAGSNHSLATVDEPWGIVHEYQERLMTEFSPVPTRPNSTIFYTGYQGFVGQSNFWHELIDGVIDGGEPVPELLHIDNGDGGPACYAAGRTFLFWSHMARQPWHTPEYMADQKRSFRGRESEFLRVWENRRVKNADTFCTEEQWGKLLAPELRAIGPDDNRVMVLAADAATKSDCCALVGVTWNVAARRFEVCFVQVWRPEDGRPLKLTKTLGPEIVRLHQAYNVAGVYYDPFQMAAISEICQGAGVNMVEFPQTARRVQSDKHLHDLVWGNNLAHYGEPTLGEHITNAMVKESERGLRIVKELSSAKVDAAVALAMAALGASELLIEQDAGMVAKANPFYTDREVI